MSTTNEEFNEWMCFSDDYRDDYRFFLEYANCHAWQCKSLPTESKFIYDVPLNERLEEFKSRPTTCLESVKLTAESYRYWMDRSLPAVGEYLIEGNLIVTVIKTDIKNVVPNDVLKAAIVDPSVRRYNGSVFHVLHSYRQLSDAEWGWRY